MCHAVSVCHDHDSVKMNKHNLKILSPSSTSHTHSSFSTPNGMAILRWGLGTPLTGASNARGVGKNCDSRRISGYRIDIW